MDRDSEALQKNYLKLLQELGLTPPDMEPGGSDPTIVAAAMQSDLTDSQRFKVLKCQSPILTTSLRRICY